MKTLADTTLPAPAVDRRWLWVARLALLACLLLMLSPLALMSWNAQGLLPWVLPYLLVLLGIQGERYREAALMWAMVIGALGMALWLGVFLFAEAGIDVRLRLGATEGILFVLLAATNLLLFLSARKAARKRTLGVRVARGAAQVVVVHSCPN
jgi:hypothetical protein